MAMIAQQDVSACGAQLSSESAGQLERLNGFTPDRDQWKLEASSGVSMTKASSGLGACARNPTEAISLRSARKPSCSLPGRAAVDEPLNLDGRVR